MHSLFFGGGGGKPNFEVQCIYTVTGKTKHEITNKASNAGYHF